MDWCTHRPLERPDTKSKTARVNNTTFLVLLQPCKSTESSQRSLKPRKDCSSQDCSSAKNTAQAKNARLPAVLQTYKSSGSSQSSLERISQSLGSNSFEILTPNMFQTQSQYPHNPTQQGIRWTRTWTTIKIRNPNPNNKQVGSKLELLYSSGVTYSDVLVTWAVCVYISLKRSFLSHFFISLSLSLNISKP